MMLIRKFLNLFLLTIIMFALSACKDTASTLPSVIASTPEPNNTYTFARSSQVEVPITFTSTGNQTSNLNVNLSDLPPGWSVQDSTSQSFNCATVSSSGTSCQLDLLFTAQTLLSNTSLTLNYSYGSVNNVLPPQNGSITIPYSVIKPTFTYVSNPRTNSLTKCILNPMDGSFLNCEIAAQNLSSISAISSQTPNNSLVAINYYGDSSENTSLWQCIPDANGNIPVACSLQNNVFPNGTFNSSSITFQAFLNNSYAYISNYPSTLVRCNVSTSGSLSGCSNITSVQGLSYPTDIAFLTLGSSNPTTYSYISQPNNNGINLCTVSSDGGTFSNCSLTDTTDFPPSVNTWGITFHNFNNINYAYVTTHAGSQDAIKQCRVNDTTGQLYGCVTTGNSFSGLAYRGSNQAVSFQNVNNTVYAYIPSAEQDGFISPGFVTKCTVDSNTGNLNQCEQINDQTNLFSPGTIAFIDSNS